MRYCIDNGLHRKSSNIPPSVDERRKRIFWTSYMLERSASPFEAHIPDQITVDLEPGDIAFYDNNILHRGVYDSTKERLTLHGSVGHVGGSKERARNVLQHGVGSWVADVNLAKVGPRAEEMRERLVKMGSESGDVGYSLQG